MNDITDKEFRQIRDHIKDKYGISLNDEKKSLVYSRLRTVLAEHGFTNFSQYFDYLVSDKTGQAAISFVDRITTNHTYFMRESAHFDFLRDTALPQVEGLIPDKDLRVWCAASSSGEEPYTLQIIIEEFFRDKPGWNTETLATDISSKVLAKAVQGVYANESVMLLPPEWRNKYFRKSGESNMAVADEVKKKLTFRIFNLMEEKFPFKKPFHIIFARNVMIYFDNETRDALVRRFYDFIVDGGYLFIGHSESLSHTDTKFKYVMPAVYRK